MKKTFILLAFCGFMAQTASAQTPSYCSSLVYREETGNPNRPYQDLKLTLKSVGAPTAGCPNGYPVWAFYCGNCGFESSVIRDPSNCNKWLIQRCDINSNTGQVTTRCYSLSTITTLSPTDNPPITGWSSNNYSVTACNTPMPVRLVSFVSEAKDNSVLLKWTTAEETNNKGFVVERSHDALAFEALGGVDGRGTSQTQQNYEYKDSAAQPGLNYYRLKQIDHDGRFQYSSVVSVINDFGLGVFPNPAQSVITLTLPQDFKASVKIMNVSGTTIREMPLSEMSKTLNISSYAMGEYWVLFSDEAGRWLKSVKVLKQ